MLSNEVLTRTLTTLREYRATIKDQSSQEFQRCEFCITIIAKLNREYLQLKNICPYSLLHIGDELDNFLSERFSHISDDLYINCAWFTREMLLYCQRIQRVPVDLKDAWNEFLYDKFPLKNEVNNSKRDYLVSGRFDIDILNNYLGDKSFHAFLNYENNLKDAEEKSENLKVNIADKVSKLENFIKGKEKRVNELAELLKEQKTAFNFVGLSKGFENLLSQKRWSKWTSFGIMSVFCVLLIALPIVIIGGRFFNWFAEYNIEWSKIGWEQMLPILGLELVFIYFFRVALTHYNSIQTQIMQLELRQSLCQFIQSYADYAKEIKEKDGASLEKFENLIFSSILSTPDKVPSTFDGLEQLSNLIKEFKK